MHTFNPSILGCRGRQISEFKASLFYRVSSRIAMATQINPVSKKQIPKNKTKQRMQTNKKGLGGQMSKKIEAEFK